MVPDAIAPALSSTSKAAPERIAELAAELAGRVNKALKDIGNITTSSRLLSLNAQVEAARAGGVTGAAFSVVAAAMQQLAEQTSTVATSMADQTGQAISELSNISKALASDVRGTRLADLALTNIDLIDRCLYERSCDCRWWATDSAAVNALDRRTPESNAYCSKRLGVILDAYTVYLDLVLCDSSGKVIANGKPDLYKSAGQDASRCEWFKTAMATRSGEEFGFQSVHVSPLCAGKPVLIYSCAVREGGDLHGRILGVLGIVFNWEALAGKIVNECPLAAGEKASTRVAICDASGLVLADNQGRMLAETIHFAERDAMFGEKKGFRQCVVNARPHVVAHALSPGFETYATGWHSLILQPAN